MLNAVSACQRRAGGHGWLSEPRVDFIAGDGVNRYTATMRLTRSFDDMVFRRRDITAKGTFDTTWYHCTDTLFSTVAILDDRGNLIERISYDGSSSGGGNARHHHPGDLNGDGAVESE